MTYIILISATVFTTEHLEPVQTSGNGQGIHFLTTFDKIYYLALALNNNTIVVAHRDELNEVICIVYKQCSGQIT